jgi:hypothetical protein
MRAAPNPSLHATAPAARVVSAALSLLQLALPSEVLMQTRRGA